MMKPLHVVTPLIESIPISQALGRRVWLKMECYQPTSSFKIRGIGRLCQQEYTKGTRHFVCSSGGNAGYAVAYVGRQLSVPVTVFVPENTPQHYIDLMQGLGATVTIVGQVWDDADKAARAFNEEKQGAYIHPFNHPAIWDGYTTLVDEIAEQIPTTPAAMVVAVGGGGLASGLIQGMHLHGWDKVPVFTVETEGAASFAGSVEAGELITLDGIDTVATTLGAQRVADQLWQLTQQHPVTALTVTDAEAVDGSVRFLDHHRVLVEPACGAGLSVAYNANPALSADGDTVIIVCGGVGITQAMLASYQHLQ